MVTVLRRDFFQVYFQNKAKNVQNFIFLVLGSNITAFYIFLHPKIYPKVSTESVIWTTDPLLVSFKGLFTSHLRI